MPSENWWVWLFTAVRSYESKYSYSTVCTLRPVPGFLFSQKPSLNLLSGKLPELMSSAAGCIPASMVSPGCGTYVSVAKVWLCVGKVWKVRCRYLIAWNASHRDCVAPAITMKFIRFPFFFVENVRSRVYKARHWNGGYCAWITTYGRNLPWLSSQSADLTFSLFCRWKWMRLVVTY